MKAALGAEGIRNLGRYTLTGKLGESCLGAVYKALSPDLDRPVAIRILSDEIRWDPEIREHFDRECRSIASMRHPNIASLLDVGQEGQCSYLVQEFLDGHDLRTLIANKSELPLEKKLSIMIETAEALSHAHGQGVLHGDLRPAHIHLAAAGSALIRDFGIARVLMRHLAHPGVRWGASIYLSPEQIQRENCDSRSDIFSAGIVFYELLTGAHPFHDANSNKAVDNILFETKLPTFDEHPDAPPAMWPVLSRCLAKDPNDRYQDMAAVAAALRTVLKDMGEDCQIMLSELLASLPRLRMAAQKPDAPQGLVLFLHEVEKLLSGRQNRDYASLDRLMTALLEQYSTIQAVTGSCAAAEPCVSSSHALPDVPDCPETAAPEESQGDSDRADHEIKPEMFSAVEPGVCASFMDDPEDRTGQLSELSAAEEAIVETPAGHESAAAPGAGATASGTEATDPDPWGERNLIDILSAAGVAVEPPDSWSATPETQVAPAESGSLSNGNNRLQNPADPPPWQPPRYRRIRRRAFRTTAGLLAVLLMAIAAYIVRLTNLGDSLSTFLSARSSGMAAPRPAAAPPGASAEASGAAEELRQSEKVQTLVAEARALAGLGRFDESRMFIRRALELDPANEAVLAASKQVEIDAAGGRPNAPRRDLRKEIARISALINAGQLKSARSELDSLQLAYPGTPEIPSLRRRWDAANSKLNSELKRREEEQKQLALRRDESARQVADLVAHGDYEEARGALSLWIADDPSSSRALELASLIEKLQNSLKLYESAMAEKRYQDALNALGSIQQMNPSDPNLTWLRAQVEARRAAGRASLTVRRLGPKANVLLDGKAIGEDGEAENELVRIGSHTLAVADHRSVQVSRTFELADGQKAVYVYDLQKQLLRPSADSDNNLVARRKLMEETHQIAVEHVHGLFRGSCKGTLTVGDLEVVYVPASGSHGFRMPFNRLNLTVSGRSLELSFASDGKGFQGFRADSEQSAENFKRAWNALRMAERRLSEQ